ncbi:MAG: hypothetical protein Q4C06_02715 [Bacillota bacterium]|nr:hypothetical protein [Bacillota bacterium]
MMHGKAGILAAALLAMCLCGGCRADGMVDEGEARRWYEEMKEAENWKEEAPGGGVHSTTEDLEGHTERNSYGMQRDGGALGMDIRKIWEDMKQ